MPMKTYKPTSSGLREQVVVDFAEVTTTRPEKSLVTSMPRTGGRNNLGRITVRHIGGGVKQKYRLVDFKRDKDNIPARVMSIEYDPNRTARLALLAYRDGEKRYMLAPQGLEVNSMVESGEHAEIKVGNCLPLKHIPIGTVIHNVELNPGQGGVLVRSAGASAQLSGKDNDYAIIKMPSGEQRMVLLTCKATIGKLSNVDHWNISLGKAGKSRKKGIRPTVRGSVMNPVDHPHGGGEGRAPIGHPGPMTPWGKPALGKKTRNRKKQTSRYILKRRK